MTKTTVLAAIFTWAFHFWMGAATDFNMDRLDYIERYKDLAVIHFSEFGIPASIKLAQGIWESQNGKSELATHSNNHFGIKCKSYWEGRTYYKEDDDKDHTGRLVESCFRAYDSVEDSYLDHSNFLKMNERYQELFTYGADYKKWAYGLRKCGYATADYYAEKLIEIIETYQLYQYDAMPESPGLAHKVEADSPFIQYEPVKKPHVATGGSTKHLREPSLTFAEQTQWAENKKVEKTTTHPQPAEENSNWLPETINLAAHFQAPMISKPFSTIHRRR